jgi:hypothetical protein
MKSMKRLLKERRDDKGQALVEFAFVVFAFVMFIFAIIEGGRLFESWITVQHASREAARWGITGQVDCPEATGDRLTCIEERAYEGLDTLSGGATAVVSVNHFEFPAYSDPATPGDPGDACDLLEIEIQYDHQVVVPLIDAITGSTITLSTGERMVNEPFGAC